MAQSINLIPQTERQEQVKTKLVKASTVFTVILFIIVMGISAFFYYQAYTLKKEIKIHDDSIASLRNKIQSMSALEVSARNLDKKYQTLSQVLSSVSYYSLLMKEFEKRLPTTISTIDFNLGNEDTITMSGTAQTYLDISLLVNNLINTKFSGSAKGLEALFTNVSLNTITSDRGNSQVKFFVVISYDGSLLKAL